MGEFVIGGCWPTGDSLELLLVGYYEEGKLLFAGKARQGLNPPPRAKSEVWEKLFKRMHSIKFPLQQHRVADKPPV